MQTLQDLAASIARHTPVDGNFDTALEGVGLVRASAATEPLHTLYEPSCCIVAQGRKRATIGGRRFEYDPANYLVVGLDLPVIGAVTEASPDVPYLSLRLQLDRTILSELLADESAPADGALPALSIEAATPQLIDAAARLVQLLDTPKDAPVLAPLVRREILYRMLQSPQAPMLRQVAHRASRLARVQKAVAYIRRHYAEAFSIDQLAAEAGMSASTFHARFKDATHMSPLRFRTMIRLQEARRLMIAEGLGAAEAGFRVGYDSPSQFSRDYARVHATPPRRDVAQLRGDVATAAD